MSKLLKFIVNLFLIAAILVAAAILVPPLAGVTTTIVDSASMDTNLPLGSVTYSTGIDVMDIQPDDEVLKVNGTSTYAYIIKTCDPENGSYEAVSATDANGQKETISLRNTVSKVAVVIPYIGYIMIAMHSLEGIIIIALVVVLMIILFVLSELWKPSERDEDEETEEDVIAQGLAQDDENDIDTDTIKAAMEDNIAAVNREETQEDAVQNMTRAERKAAKKAAKQAEKDAKAAAKLAEKEAVVPAKEEAAVAVEETVTSIEETAAETVEETVADAQESVDAYFGGESLADALADTRRETQENEFEREAPIEPHVSDVVSAVEQVMAGIVQEERKRDEIPSLETDAMIDAQSGSMTAARDEETNAAGQFRKVKRPTLNEIETTAKAEGRDPSVKKDDNTGVSIVDYTDLL